MSGAWSGKRCLRMLDDNTTFPLIPTPHAHHQPAPRQLLETNLCVTTIRGAIFSTSTPIKSQKLSTSSAGYFKRPSPVFVETAPWRAERQTRGRRTSVWAQLTPAGERDQSSAILGLLWTDYRQQATRLPRLTTPMEWSRRWRSFRWNYPRPIKVSFEI